MLDTTFLVDLVRGDPGARAFLADAERGSEALRVPAPALARLWEAVERMRQPPRDASRLAEILGQVAHAPLDAAAARRAGRLLGAAARAGDALDPFDALVAAVAIEADEALVTRNVREYGRVPDLRVRTY